MRFEIGDIVSIESPPLERAILREANADFRLIIHVERDCHDVIAALLKPRLEGQSEDQNSVLIKKEDLIGARQNEHMIAYIGKLVTIDVSKCRRVGRLKHEKTDEMLRKLASLVTRNHFKAIHRPAKFSPGTSRIPYAGRVYDESEMINLVEASLDLWLTAGRFADRFEKEFAKLLGVKYCSLVNSGSSANLLAVAALTSPKLGEKRLKPGDEVITVAAGFPTTMNPILQYGLVPVFVDIDIPTYNINPDLIEPAVSAKTRAIMLAHALGNPFEVKEVLKVAKRHNLWIIEDCCDALGSQYFLESSPDSLVELESIHSLGAARQSSFVGTFGHISTFSFYPAHHINMGEGGAVMTNDLELKVLVESFRDWGRDCYCPPGRDNTCGKRFSRQLGDLPFGYDHKYVYSHFGYNLKITDMQAAVGCAQLEKLPSFIKARKRNWRMLREGLTDLEDLFILPEPTPKSDPSWFGFPLTVRESSGLRRDDIVMRLENKGIQTRNLFAGNIIRHPCFDDLRASGRGYRIVSEDSTNQPTNGLTNSLLNTDVVMNRTFWIGVYPGMLKEMVQFMIKTLHDIYRP